MAHDEGTLNRCDQRFSALEGRASSLEGRANSVEIKMGTMTTQVDRMFKELYDGDNPADGMADRVKIFFANEDTRRAMETERKEESRLLWRRLGIIISIILSAILTVATVDMAIRANIQNQQNKLHPPKVMKMDEPQSAHVKHPSQEATEEPHY